MKSHFRYAVIAIFSVTSVNMSYASSAYAAGSGDTSSIRTIIPLPTPENCALYYTAYCAGRDISKLGKLSPLRAFCEICGDYS
jgi:hypothetical protein